MLALKLSLADLPDNYAPPNAYGYSNQYLVNAPFVFEAVAGQPVSFSLTPPGDIPAGVCGLTITIERLQ